MRFRILECLGCFFCGHANTTPKSRNRPSIGSHVGFRASRRPHVGTQANRLANSRQLPINSQSPNRNDRQLNISDRRPMTRPSGNAFPVASGLTKLSGAGGSSGTAHDGGSVANGGKPSAAAIRMCRRRGPGLGSSGGTRPASCFLPRAATAPASASRKRTPASCAAPRDPSAGERANGRRAVTRSMWAGGWGKRSCSAGAQGDEVRKASVHVDQT